MKITIKDVASNSPLSGIPVTVDGTYAGSTDLTGVLDSAPSGTMVESPGNFKFLFTDPLDDREIWCETPAPSDPPLVPLPLLGSSETSF